jgi:hypothetical protein
VPTPSKEALEKPSTTFDYFRPKPASTSYGRHVLYWCRCRESDKNWMYHDNKCFAIVPSIVRRDYVATDYHVEIESEKRLGCTHHFNKVVVSARDGRPTLAHVLIRDVPPRNAGSSNMQEQQIVEYTECWES